MTYRFDEEKMVTDVGMSVASAPITALVAGATVAEKRGNTPSRAKRSFEKE